MIRTDSHKKLLELAEAGAVPVINGLTDKSHPCQLMADILTFEEHKGSIKDRIVAWTGDGNNVASSWIHAAALFDFELRLACPPSLQPDDDAVAWARQRNARVHVTTDPREAVEKADCVVTDTWVSMGDEDRGIRHNLLAPYQVNDGLMVIANKEALFMHCLPAHRGEEVTDSVIDGPQSVVFDGAENRLHAQKDILLWCMGDNST
jgi:ornithine carbamoyltransferase